MEESSLSSSSSSVQVKEAVLITPSLPTPSQVLSLSALDSQLFIRFTIEYLLIYRPRPVSDHKSLAARIKSALASALVPYYPLAGRIRANPNNNLQLLEVVCRAQGAVFIEATTTTTTVSFSEFQRAPRYTNQWRNLLSLHVDDVLSGSPPLIVQLTWLPNGAATLGVGFNHCLCDGIGSAEFLNLFADLATGCVSTTTSSSSRRGRGREGRGDFKHKPVWDRILLNPIPVSTKRVRPVAHPEYNRVQDLCGFVSRFASEPLSPTSIVFDRKSLNGIKNLASSTIAYTSFEVLSAHVWRSWAMALELPREQTLRMLFTVNIRNRVKPNLPNGFYGNGFVLGCAQTSVGELTVRGLGWAASLVKKAKERVGDEYVRSVIEAVSSSSSSSQPRANPDSVGVLIVSQWSRLGLDKVDFGMGKPVHVGPVCTDRYCLFLPVFEQKDAVKVMVAVPKSAAGKYEYLLRSPSLPLIFGQ